MKRLFSLLLVSTLAREVPVEAAEGGPFQLTLRQAIQIALENNTDIQIEKENVRFQEAAFRVENAQFDPTLHMDARADKSIQSSTSLIETEFLGTNKFEQQDQKINAGVKQRFFWGGDYDLTLGQTRSTATLQEINPTLQGTALLTFTQPLLRGFGSEIAQGPFRIAQTQYVISQSAFKAQLLQTLLDIDNVYWDLVFQRENLEVQRQALQSAQQLLEMNRAKVDLGVLAPIEILVAEAGVASREEGVVVAQKGVKDAEDQVRRLLNLPEQSMTNPPEITPVDRPTEEEKKVEEEKLLETALRRRPEIEQSRLDLQNRALSVRIAQNQLLPSLDLVGTLGRNGLGGAYPGEIDQLRSGAFYQWEAGLVLTFPLGNRAARANLQKERAGWEKATLAQRKVIQQITLEAKEGLRRVRTDFQRIETTRRARVLSEKKLSAGYERFNLGLISSHDLLEFQNELADAKGKEIKAISDYNKSLANLDKVAGTLLDQVGVQILDRTEGPR